MTPRNKILARLMIILLIPACLALAENAKATLIWKLDIKKCPSCRHPVAQKIYASKNTFGARYWSDGKMEKAGYDDDLAFVECSRCRSAFWIGKAKNMGEVDVLSKPDRDKIIRSEKKVSKRSPYDNVALIPSEDNWYRAIIDRNYRDGGEERYLRVHAWWSSNDRYRNPNVRNQPARKAREWENMAALFKLIKVDTQEGRLMKAELAREMGWFKEAQRLLDFVFKEEYQTAFKGMRDRAREKDTALFPLI
jgi:uncharacterized protein involved in tolerance to divalent cations